MLRGRTRGPLLRLLVVIMRKFKKKVTITRLFEGNYERTAMFVSNHSGASGPMNLTIYFQEFFRPLGTYEMVGNYKERWNYLYHIFYQKKLKYSKKKSFILATLLAIISRILYYDIGLIPTYPDARFISTIKKCTKALKDGQSILIFPEDSSQEYAQQISKFFAGFVVIARKYYEASGIDIPIYPMYFSKARLRIIVGEKVFIQPLIQQGMNDDEIADYFRLKVNEYGRMIYEEKTP